MSITLYHNPRCSKSRATLQLLQSNGHEPTIVEYLTTPPTEQELAQIIAMLGIGPRDLMRKNEEAFKSNALDDPELSDEQLIAAMVANPILIERPVVVTNGRAAIGRPPESVLEIL